MQRPKILIVYYSRSGTTRTAAILLGALLGCEVEEIIDTKPRAGLRGWLGCAYDGLLGRCTRLAPSQRDPGAYDLVLIGTPIWALNVSAPVRTYLELHHLRLREVAFFLTHGGIARARVLERMSRLARRAPRAELGITAREFDRGEHLGKCRDFASGLIGLVEADAKGVDPSTQTKAALTESASLYGELG
jgi:flavodoxin